MKCVTIFAFVILNFLTSNVKANATTCPSFSQTANFNDAKELDTVQDTIFEHLWDAEYPDLSCSADKFEEMIYDLRESGNKVQEDYALAVSEFIWSYIPQLDKRPNLFPYTNLIRANAEFIEHGKCRCSDIIDALDDVKPAVVEAISLALDTAVENAGCSCDNYTETCKQLSCPYKYHTCDVWDNDDGVYSCDWKKRVIRLGRSDNKIDKTIALLASVFVTKPMMVLEKALNPIFKYQVYDMAGTEKIPIECCAQFIEDVVSLKAISEDMVDFAVDDAKISTGCKNNTCENFRCVGNFSNPAEVNKMQADLFDKFWNTSSPRISKYARKLESVLRYMAFESNVPFWQVYAISATDWIWTHLPSVDIIPHYCAYAATINATVEYSETKDCPTLLKGFNHTIKAFTEAGYFASETSIKNAGCESRPVTISDTSCWRDGFAYDFYEIWDLEGWKYPCALKKIVYKLYHSCHYNDRVIALFASSVLSTYMTNMLSGYSPEPVFRTFVMLNKGKIDEKCCPSFIREARELVGAVQVMNLKTFRAAIKATGCLN